VTFLLWFACATDPNSPPHLAFDRAACAHCGMLVSEPRHAAALRVREGAELPFDDPGCLFQYVLEQRPAVTQMWFHTPTEWVREDAVAFLAGGQTPMGSGLLAVEVGTAGSLGVGEASGLALGGGGEARPLAAGHDVAEAHR
jgi:hypothetical protein